MNFHLEYIKLCYVYSKLSPKPTIKDVTLNTVSSVTRKYATSFYILLAIFFFKYIVLPHQVLEVMSSHHEYNEKYHQIYKTSLIATKNITRWGWKMNKNKNTYIKETYTQTILLPINLIT